MANRIRFTTAAQVAHAYPELPRGLENLPEDVNPADFMIALAANADPVPAVFFAGLALPKREAVWWGCMVLRAMNLVSGEAGRGLALAEAWARKPEEDERRAAGEFAEEVYFQGPGGWIAFSAFTTSGSLAPAGLQAVPPSPEISGKAAAMAVLLATEASHPMVRLANIRAAVACAREFGLGGDGNQAWKDLAAGKFAPEPAMAQG